MAVPTIAVVSPRTGGRLVINQTQFDSEPGWTRWEDRGETPAPPAALRNGGPADDPDRDTVAIPASWRKLSWPRLRSLAADLTPEPVMTRDQAKAVVATELERRGNEKA